MMSLFFWSRPFFELGANTFHRYNDELIIKVVSEPSYALSDSTLSKTRGRADLLIWLHKRIEEKSFEGWKVFPLARSSLVSVLSRMLVWPYRPIHLLNVHFSRFDMLTPSMFSPDYYCDPDMHQCMEWNF